MLSQQKSNMDDFGHQFDLNRGMISQYVRMIATPKLELFKKYVCITLLLLTILLIVISMNQK
jgi:hypothetical protein